MSVRLWRLALMTMLTLAPAWAQTAGIDPALVARANAGDTAAEVRVGECYRCV